MLHCQKCHVPLDPAKGLKLDPVSFRLLADSSSGTDTPPAAPGLESSIGTSGPGQNEQRDEMYRTASRDNPNGPVYSRSTVLDGRTASPVSAASSNGPREDAGSMSFVMLTQSQVQPTAGSDGGWDNRMSSQMQVADKMFEILSGRSDVDHPICADCGTTLVEGLRAKLNAAYKERNAYVSLLREAHLAAPDQAEMADLERTLEVLRKKQETALGALRRLEGEKRKLLAEVRKLETESRDLDEAEEQFWDQRNQFSVRLHRFKAERDRLANRYEHDVRQLQWLQEASVYNDTFSISREDQCGTINGLRLGSAANPTVDEAEINAAWGQACLLLVILAEKNEYEFKGFRLNPMGSFSTIERIDQHVASSTFLGSSIAGSLTGRPKVSTLSLFCNSRTFNAAMEAFLECLRQLGEFISERTDDRSLLPVADRAAVQSRAADSSPAGPSTVPKSTPEPRPGATTASPRPRTKGLLANSDLEFTIVGDKINGASIRYKSLSWTAACWYMLAYCKCLLAITSRYATQTLGADRLVS